MEKNLKEAGVWNELCLDGLKSSVCRAEHIYFIFVTYFQFAKRFLSQLLMVSGIPYDKCEISSEDLVLYIVIAVTLFNNCSFIEKRRIQGNDQSNLILVQAKVSVV